MASRSGPSVRINKYTKTDILKQLRDAENAVLGSLKSYEEEFQEWKTTVVGKFQKFVDGLPPENDRADYYSSISFNDFNPPKMNQACRDYRVQNLNRTIVRIEAMAEDEKGVITLAGNDPLWDYMSLAACL